MLHLRYFCSCPNLNLFGQGHQLQIDGRPANNHPNLHVVHTRTKTAHCVCHKLIVVENLLSFKVLEQKIFESVCELGRQITQQILEPYDTELAESRDKKHYRGKGKRKTCIKTV